MTAQQKIAVFGASGAIGCALTDWFLTQNYEVVAFHRPNTATIENGARWVTWDGVNAFPTFTDTSFNAAVWAQGANYSDNIHSFDIDAHQQLYAANVSYILLSLQALLQQNLFSKHARLCVISSIWQNIARQNKLSYCITKAALQGLVQSLAIDLGTTHGYLINAVLPGALDTPMTRANLSEAQIERLEEMTPLGSLANLADVSNLVGFLCSASNTSITGQFIAADKGFSYAKIV